LSSCADYSISIAVALEQQCIPKGFKYNQYFLGEDDDKSLEKNNRIEAIISKKKLNLTLGFRTYCNCRDIN